MTEKLQKVLARAGVGSRRQIEMWIEAGRITVNDKIAKLGERVTSKATICVDGKKINISKKIDRRVLLYNKPVGEICTRSDEKGRTTVFAHLPPLKTGRWVIVGRLDLNSSGLLLFTNDGELANKLMHPSSMLEREYLVRIYGTVTPEILKDLQQGVILEDGMAKFKSIQVMQNQWFRVVITEGRNRLVRRLWQAKGLAVSKLIRTRFDDIILPKSLKPGLYKFFNYNYK